ALPSPELTLPVTAGAITVIYNLGGATGHLNLSGAVLAEIYLGRITHWNDPAIAVNNSGRGLPSTTILTVHRSDPAGTTYVLTDFLARQSPAWATGPGKGISVSFPSGPLQEAVHGNSALLTYVETTPNTLGYSDLTDVLASSSPPSYAAILNPAHEFVVPTLASTQSAVNDASSAQQFPASSGDWYNVSLVDAPGASDYPLATLVYAYAYAATDHGFAPSPAKSAVLVGWLHWVLTTGQADAAPNDYAGLPTALLNVDEAGLSTMTFNGASIPFCT
ncbi:MAG: substrate-binding domain-containing protein, partial [Thermoplasmata archaeon]|nr:substrate-binding domain-containing protein [Thermoplasmata archaeon]